MQMPPTDNAHADELDAEHVRCAGCGTIIHVDDAEPTGTYETYCEGCGEGID